MNPKEERDWAQGVAGVTFPLDVQWLTTEQNPDAPQYGVDQGQRRWRVHAVIFSGKWHGKLPDIRALCGLLPAHGWGMDLFVRKPCWTCVKRLRTLGATVRIDFTI